MLAGVGHTQPGRSHQCVAVNPLHDHPEFKQFRVRFLESYGHPVSGRDDALLG